MTRLKQTARLFGRRAKYVTRLLRRLLAPRWLPGDSCSWGPPRRFALDHEAVASEVVWHAVHPEVRAARPLPRVWGGPMPHLFASARECRWPAVGVAEIPGGRAWGHYGAAVLAPSDTLIGEFSRDVWSPAQHTAFLRWKLPRCQRIAGTVAVIATPEAGNNYWHWTTELLPRLHLLEAAGFPLASIDRFFVNTSGARYQRESLAELGIEADRILVATPAVHLQAERLLVPSVNHHHGEIAPWACSWLQQRPAAPAAAGRARRLFLSRQGAPFRRLTNEPAAIELAAQHGFEVLHPERCSVGEQRSALAEASWVIGPHGSAFTNLMWCRPGTAVGEFFGRNYLDLVFWKTASTLGLEYSCLLEPGTTPDVRSRDRRADYTVDLALLTDYLRSGSSRRAS
jgi:capsular polysaccharide biosynthesis protein